MIHNEKTQYAVRLVPEEDQSPSVCQNLLGREFTHTPTTEGECVQCEGLTCFSAVVNRSCPRLARLC